MTVRSPNNRVDMGAIIQMKPHGKMHILMWPKATSWECSSDSRDDIAHLFKCMCELAATELAYILLYLCDGMVTILHNAIGPIGGRRWVISKATKMVSLLYW